jgi:hypothetical protein
VVELRLAPRSREATPNNGKGVSSDVTAKGGKKRRKQHPQWATAMASYDSDNDEKAGGSNGGRAATAAHNSKHGT